MSVSISLRLRTGCRALITIHCSLRDLITQQVEGVDCKFLLQESLARVMDFPSLFISSRRVRQEIDHSLTFRRCNIPSNFGVTSRGETISFCSPIGNISCHHQLCLPYRGLRVAVRVYELYRICRWIGLDLIHKLVALSLLLFCERMHGINFCGSFSIAA